MLVNRSHIIDRIRSSFEVNRIVCLIGPRQCGKTTIARQIWHDCGKNINDSGYFDLEKPSDLEALQSPDLVLPHLDGLIVIDEVQRKADLFAYLRYLHDLNLNQKFLILGSAAKELIQQSSESLAGRISYIEITPFAITEVNNWQRLWTQGGFPRSYILDNSQSIEWRENYMRTYVEQDLVNLGFNFQTDVIRKLWIMLAHYHGQILNASELAASLGVSQPTITKYLAFLSGSFMIRVLNPWFENIKKRQVKSPKIYYRDSGLLHYVLGIKSYNDIFMNPKSGASWEGFALEEVIKYYKEDGHNCYFWASHNKAELDLMILRNGKRLGFEFKLSDNPKLSASMGIALNDLKLDTLTVIYPGQSSYRLRENIFVEPLSKYTMKI